MRIADLIPLAIVLGLLVLVLIPGLWYVKKTTGRTVRDMLALLGGAITFLLLMAPPLMFFRNQIDSPDRSTRKLTQFILFAVYMPVAVVVTWAFNRLVKRRSNRDKQEHENRHQIGKVNSPDSR